MSKNHNKYRKDKPWDTEDIDHWKLDEWNPDHLKGNLLEESSFATLFPKYREKYLRDVWPVVTKCLEVSDAHFYDVDVPVLIPYIRTHKITFLSSSKEKWSFLRVESCGGFYDCQDDKKDKGSICDCEGERSHQITCQKHSGAASCENNAGRYASGHH